MLNQLHITDTESKILSNSPESDARVHKALWTPTLWTSTLWTSTLWTRASESGHLDKIFDSVSVI
jgi:hypothetical protein